MKHLHKGLDNTDFKNKMIVVEQLINWLPSHM